MKTIAVFIICLLISIISFAQNDKSIIITSDINNFWTAYDQLKDCKTKEDSIHTMQSEYLDKASEGLKLFIKARNLTADHYIALISKFPKFWNSVRPNTLQLNAYTARIETIFDQYEKANPKFKRPNVCFAIGRLSTGGTVSKGWLLIGSEIACADSTTDKSELGTWLNSVMLPENQVLELVSHETVHTQQKMSIGTIWGYLNYRLLTLCLREGAADFVAKQVAGITINKNIYAYGTQHEQELWQEFSKVMYQNDFSKWLYNGNNAKDRPADLGYFMGYKICESYYNQMPNKQKALRKIIRMSSPRTFYKKSKYPVSVSY